MNNSKQNGFFLYIDLCKDLTQQPATGSVNGSTLIFLFTSVTTLSQFPHLVGPILVTDMAPRFLELS